MPGGIDYSSLVQKHMGNIYSRTNVTTTSSGYSAPSTANQIADALLGVGSMVAMMAIASKAQGGGNQVSSSMSAKTSAMAAKTKAQAIINIYSPKVAELKSQISADADYKTKKSELEGKLAELNERAGATKSKDDVPQIAANLQSARADLNTWTQKSQEYENNAKEIAALDSATGSTPTGKTINYLNNGKANTQTDLKEFGYDDKKPETKSAAESAMRQFNSIAQQKEANYNTLTRNNQAIQNQAKTITTYDESGNKITKSADKPSDVKNIIQEGINNLEKLKLGTGTNEMSPDSYLQEKAKIESDIQALDANHAQIESLKTRLATYESKIDEANIAIAEADATIAQLDASAQQINSNNAEISGLKAINKNMKKAGGDKKLFGIKVGKKYSEEQKLAREQNKHRMAELRSQNDILNS